MPTADVISQVLRAQSSARASNRSIRALPAIGWKYWQINCPATSPGIRMRGTDSSGRRSSRLSAIAAGKPPVTAYPPSRVVVSTLIPTASLPLGLHSLIQVVSPALSSFTDHMTGGGVVEPPKMQPPSLVWLMSLRLPSLTGPSYHRPSLHSESERNDRKHQDSQYLKSLKGENGKATARPVVVRRLSPT